MNTGIDIFYYRSFRNGKRNCVLTWAKKYLLTDVFLNENVFRTSTLFWFGQIRELYCEGIPYWHGIENYCTQMRDRREKLE